MGLVAHIVSYGGKQVKKYALAFSALAIMFGLIAGSAQAVQIY